jgi:superfamily II DNA or RNA helicase
MKLTLRDYQQQAVEDIRNAYRSSKKAPLLALPTGGGKTVIFSYITECATALGNSTLILVHRRELISQTSKALTSLGVDHGVIAANWPKSDAPVQVASVQTLVRRLHKCDFDPDLIIIDEAHHAVAGTWATILDHFHTAKRLGVTATPVRLDGKGLNGYFDDIVIGPSVAKLTEEEFLAPARCFSTPTKLDRDRLRTEQGEYESSSTYDALESLKINGEAISEYEKHCPGKPAIVFCVSKKHAEVMAERFSNAGFESAFLHSGVKTKDREELIENLGNGKLDILTSVNVISEGTDIPVVTAAILLRPTKSEALYLQQVGRVLRTAEGKEAAIIIDCVGNIRTFGLPTDEREYTLDGKITGNAPPVKECPRCYAVLPSITQICPECGHVFTKKLKPEPIRKTTIIRELVEVTGAQEKAEAKPVHYTRSEKTALINSVKSKADLYRLAKEWGYKPGWAHYKWEELQSRGRISRTTRPSSYVDAERRLAMFFRGELPGLH